MDLLLDIYEEETSLQKNNIKDFYEQYFDNNLHLLNDNDILQNLFLNEYDEFIKIKNKFCNKISFADNLIEKNIVNFDLSDKIFNIMNDLV